jgi:hypothetical protein
MSQITDSLLMAGRRALDEPEHLGQRRRSAIVLTVYVMLP